MTRGKDKFTQHLKRCSEIVASWPEWKQVVLGGVIKKQEKDIMPDLNIPIDKLRAVSPRIVAIEWVDTDADRTSQRHCPLCFEVEEAGHGHADDCEWPTIAADLLRLAEENEQLRFKFVNFFKQLKASAEKYRSITAKVSLELLDEMIKQFDTPAPAGKPKT